MTTDIIRENGLTTVAVSGRVDTVTAPEFEKQTACVTAEGETGDITIDCKDMDYISSAGLRSFISMLKRAKAQGRELRVVNLSGPIRQIFDMTGFTSLFKID